jgi:hypothetical protein
VVLGCRVNHCLLSGINFPPAQDGDLDLTSAHAASKLEAVASLEATGSHELPAGTGWTLAVTGGDTELSVNAKTRVVVC